MRRVVTTVVALVVTALMQGCDVGTSDSGTVDPTGACHDQTYDLTSPPTRADLGMADGSSTVTLSCDGGFEVSLDLPKGASTTFTARQVNADSYAAADSTTGDPTTIDVSSVALDQDTAVQVTNGVADDLGIDSTPVRQWQFDLKANPSDNAETPFMRATHGPVTAELQLQYLAASGNSYLHLVLSWT